jgi:hypothetical protein
MSSAYRLQFFPITVGVLAAANCALFLFLVDKTLIHGPVMDMLDTITFYGDRRSAGDLFGYLWDPENEHRVVLFRLLVAFDLRWFGRIGPSFILSGLFLVFAMATTIGWEIMHSDLPAVWKRVALAISILLVTPANIVVMVSGPNNCVYLQTCAFALFSLVLLDGIREQCRFSIYRRIAAVLAACVAALGVSAGLLIWPVLIWSAWRGSLRWTWIVGISCAGAVFIAAYTWHLPEHVAGRIFTLTGVVGSFDYIIRFLGLPWSRMPILVWPGRLIGFGALCLGLFALARDMFLGLRITRLQRIGLGLILFSLLVAGVAPLARLDFSEGVEVPIRYGMFVVPLHCGLLLWSLEFMHEYFRPARRVFAPWAILPACVIWLAQQVVVGEYAIATVNQINNAWSRYIAGEWSPDMLKYIYPNREIAEARRAYLREMHLYDAE